MKNINTIIFDFGGVILDIDFQKINSAFASLGVSNFRQMYSQQDADPLFKNLEEGKITDEEFYALFNKKAKVDLDNSTIQKAWNSMLLSYRKNALFTLTTLKDKYKLYLLSNTNSIHVDAFNKIFNEEIGEGSLEDYFDKIYFSHQIKYRKPDKEAYEYVIKENKLDASKTLFIDDSIQNIEGAKAVGLQTIFLQQGTVIEDLDL